MEVWEQGDDSVILINNNVWATEFGALIFSCFFSKPIWCCPPTNTFIPSITNYEGYSRCLDMDCCRHHRRIINFNLSLFLFTPDDKYCN